MMLNTVTQGDCLEVMKEIPDKSVDMVLCDLPYGTTACKWDTVIPFEPLWAQYKRVIKDKGAIVLTADQPFTSSLVMSNPSWFKYQWLWVKDYPTGFLNANVRPMKITEDVIVFSNGHASPGQKTPSMYYHPQGLQLVNVRKENKPNSRGAHVHAGHQSANVINSTKSYTQKYKGYPSNLLNYKRDLPQLHPTQKPVALFEYLIRTYTNEGDTVLDNCAGSGTTGVAALNTGRNFILIEKEPEYVEIANRRIQEALNFKERKAS